MRAGFFQFGPAFGNKIENFSKVENVIGEGRPDLLVLPEFFATGYQFLSVNEVSAHAEPVPDGPTTAFLSELSKKEGMYIVGGLPESADGTFYNSAILTGPGGFIGLYRKTHLYSEENLYFSPGDTGFRVWETDAGRIGIMVCFDWFFPESMRTLAVKGADIVAHPSNLVLPYCPDAMPVRCLENRVYSVTANRTGTEERKEGRPLTFIGKSEVVSPDGRILVRAPDEEEVLMVVEIDPASARDKVLNQYNDILKNRRPDIYEK